jgi:hypothetical protein
VRDYLYFRKALRFAPRSMEAAPQFNRAVIPAEPKDSGRDPESRKVAENQIVLDPGSHPALRDLAGMTNYDTASC